MKITVITVVFNSANTITDALRSVANQDYQDVEHIVIDGNSTDGTVDIIKQNAGSIDHFVSEPDQGIYDAMNKGLALATGDVIGFLNSDDVYAANDVLTKVARAHTSENLDAVYADLVYVDDLADKTIKRRWLSRAYTSGLCFRGWMPAHPTLYIKRNVVRQIGEFDITLGNQADLEFCARAFEIQQMSSRYFPEVWVRMRTGGASQSDIVSMIKSNWRSYKALWRLGMRKDPVSFFLIKFGSKLPQFFLKS